MQKDNKKTIFAVSGTVVVVLGVLAAFLFVFIDRPQQHPMPQEEVVEPTANEEILQALSIPSGEDPATEARKRQIQKALSELSNEEPPSEEEQQEIVEALQKPAE